MWNIYKLLLFAFYAKLLWVWDNISGANLRQ